MREYKDHAANYAIAALLAIFVFLIDLATPWGVESWMGYLIPLLLVARSHRARSVVVCLVACTALMVANLYLEHPALGLESAVVNRLLAMGGLWAVGMLVIQHDRVEAGLQAATLDALHASEAANEALRASQAQLHTLSLRLVESVEDERRAIARELHDEAGQSLTALQLSLGRLRDAADDGDLVRVRTGELLALSGTIMEQLHHLAMNLRPISLDRYGLVPALEQYVASVRRQSGLEVDFVTAGLDHERLPHEVESTVYRVVQEALTNVARHAHATRAGVVVERRGCDCVAIVEDDGVGFDVQEALLTGRLGLVGMRERTTLLGGNLDIESAPGKGTTVFAEVPCETEAVAIN